MKKIITLLILVIVSILFQNIVFLPWWSFLVPVFFLGVIFPLQKWNISSFQLGFVAGFLVWALSAIYFEIKYNGELTHKIGNIMHVPYYILYIIVGLVGGLLMGLAFYAGYLLRRGKEALKLESF